MTTVEVFSGGDSAISVASEASCMFLRECLIYTSGTSISTISIYAENGGINDIDLAHFFFAAILCVNTRSYWGISLC